MEAFVCGSVGLSGMPDDIGMQNHENNFKCERYMADYRYLCKRPYRSVHKLYDNLSFCAKGKIQ